MCWNFEKLLTLWYHTAARIPSSLDPCSHNSTNLTGDVLSLEHLRSLGTTAPFESLQGKPIVFSSRDLMWWNDELFTEQVLSKNQDSVFAVFSSCLTRAIYLESHLADDIIRICSGNFMLIFFVLQSLDWIGYFERISNANSFSCVISYLLIDCSSALWWNICFQSSRQWRVMTCMTKNPNKAILLKSTKFFRTEVKDWQNKQKMV